MASGQNLVVFSAFLLIQAFDQWPVVGGQWSEPGRIFCLPIDTNLRSVVSGQWPVASGQNLVVSSAFLLIQTFDQWPVNRDQRPLAPEP